MLPITLEPTLSRPASYSKVELGMVLIKQQPCKINEDMNNASCRPTKPTCSMQTKNKTILCL